MAELGRLGDDEQPSPASAPTEPAPVTAPQEVGSDSTPLGVPRGSGPENGLERFLWIHPCTGYFAHLAHLQGAQDPAGRSFAALRDRDRKFYWVCVSIDLFFTFAASAALLATAGFLVWVTIWQPHLGG